MLTQTIISLACPFGRYGYGRIHWLLAQQGWGVGLNRVKWTWLREGLRVPSKQPNRGKPWLNDGSCIRLRPTHGNHVWSYNFAKCLKALKGLTPYEHICEIWTEQPKKFRLDLTQHMPGLNAALVPLRGGNRQSNRTVLLTVLDLRAATWLGHTDFEDLPRPVEIESLDRTVN